MIITLLVLAVVCLLSLAYLLAIPPLARTKWFLHFLPEDIREAGKQHPDPSPGRQLTGYLLTLAALSGYLGALVFLGLDGLRRGYGFGLLFGRFLLFMAGYKLFDILIQDQYLVITKKYFVRFFPETAGCRSWWDRSFNTKKQLFRLKLLPVVCALLSGLTLLMGR